MDAQVSNVLKFGSALQQKTFCDYYFIDFLGEVFGLEIGQHSRSAIGVNVLPLGVPIEIEAIFEIRE